MARVGDQAGGKRTFILAFELTPAGAHPANAIAPGSWRPWKGHPIENVVLDRGYT
jgi:hypothetical protein